MAQSTGTTIYSTVTAINGVVIEQVTKLPFGVGKTGKVPITNMDSGRGMEFLGGRYDPGDTTVTGVYAAGKTGQIALKAAFVDGLRKTFTITSTAGTVVSLVASVGSFDLLEEGDAWAFTANLQISGIPTQNTSFSALTTPFFAVTTSTGIIPAPSVTGQNYVVNIATGTASVTITPTDATALATIYVNDVVVASGAASGTITLGSAASLTNAVIRVEDPGAKAPCFYNLILARA